MSHRRPVTVPGLVVIAALVLLAGAAAPAWADVNPVLTHAVSRRAHGGSSYDVALPLTGNTGIECRRTGGSVTIVLTFDQPIVAGNVSVLPTTATVAAGSPSIDANTMTVNLNGIADRQSYTVSVSNVQSAAGGTLASGSVVFRTLEGDINSSGQVTVTDVTLCKNNVGVPVTGFNFRADVNRNNSVTATDVSQVKSKSSLPAIAGGATFNTPPTIGDITDKSTNTGEVTLLVPIADNELQSDKLAIRAVSSNASLCPPSSFVFSGSGSTRTLEVKAAQGQTGSATITVSVGDGLASASDSFVLNVQATPQLFLSNLRAMPAVVTQGWGSAWLTLDGDETAATVRVETSTLTSAKGPQEIRDGAGTVLINLTTLTPRPDGTYRWFFANPASDAAAIKSGNCTLTIKTSARITGEIRGSLVPAASLTFNPPAAPPALPGGTPTVQDVARFLTQAAFGPTTAEITRVQSMGYEAWLNEQFNPAVSPPSLVYPIVYQRCTTSSASGDSLVTDRTIETWWKHAITANDQLRQRIATVYSEIFVVSAVDEDISVQPAGLATYYDMLINNAFGNFRTILKDVTLHPIMGQYLNMRGNVRPTSPRFTAPNENYAREILQLFSIGLNQLNPDGTPQLNARGELTETYGQPEIIGFSHVFTGWNTDPTPVPIPTSQPATQPIVVNSFYNKPMVLNANNHSTSSKLLLNGVVLPAINTTNATAAQSNAELDAALDNIFNHPNCGPFISRQLIQRLVTSNPSPGYVYRVAEVFNNDGTGVRGNMRAVVRAVLVDYEARTTSLLNTPGYGHLREPIIKYANIIRALHPTSTTGHFKIGRTDGSGQTILRASTVFNFFEPYFSPPGYVADAGLLAPEFQIASETNTISGLNTIYNGIYSSWPTNDVRLDLATERDIAKRPVTGSSDLLDHLNLLLMSGQMPSDMRSRILTRINSMAGTTDANFLDRARAAVHLIATSPQFATQR